jgi:hypothetical protein
MNSINMMAETTSRVDGHFNFVPVVWVRINVFRRMMRVTTPVSGYVEDEWSPTTGIDRSSMPWTAIINRESR